MQLLGQAVEPGAFGVVARLEEDVQEAHIKKRWEFGGHGARLIVVGPIEDVLRRWQLGLDG